MGLMACSTNRKKYEWMELRDQDAAAVVAVESNVQVWGEADSASEVKLAPGNLLSISYLEDKELNGDFRIDFEGLVALPYEVNLKLAGLTLAKARAKLIEAYSPFFKNASSLRVKLEERKRFVDVRGLVLKPGKYLVDASTSLDQLITESGGLSKDPGPQFVRVTRAQKSLLIDLGVYYDQGSNRSQIANWMGGEVVFFQKEGGLSFEESRSARPKIFMLGEIRKPGELSYQADAGFVNFLTQAGGFTELADQSRIEVVRRKGNLNKVYVFEWKEFHRAPRLEDGDVIFVHSDTDRKLERNLQIAGILASIVTSIAVLITIL